LEAYFIEYGRQDRQPGEFVERVRVPLPAEGQPFAARERAATSTPSLPLQGGGGHPAAALALDPDVTGDGYRTDGGRLRCYKVAKRFDQDISAVLGCFDVAVADGRVASARLAYGGMAGVPKRAAAAEVALTGQPWTRGTVEAAMAALDGDFAPLSDWRASAGYRMRCAKNLLMRYWLETAGSGVATDVREIA
ncbi:MAG TPA: hypothetical protein VFJ13_06015, partial [Paracoccaceae bacterium]|nr:hypothetical protein [Paracoccaceae bacterium]